MQKSTKTIKQRGRRSRTEVRTQRFYTKSLMYRGIAIRAGSVVDGKALTEARRRLRMILLKVPVIASNLRAYGAEFHIIGKDQNTSDLPEYWHFHGKPFDGEMDVDERARGLGGLPASCGEENLLFLKDDRYFSKDICVHEFAHTIHMYGLDERACFLIESQYHRSVRKGLWKGCYANSNVKEFFAEACMWYFGTHGNPGSIKPEPKPGPQWLKKYDPGCFKLLDDLFSGRTIIEKVDLTKLKKLPVSQESKTRSKSADQRTQITFRNTTELKMKVFWLDYQGKRKHYNEIEPMSSYVQSTFATHAWLITDERNHPEAMFVAKPYPGIAFI